jgi:hypothetical protein
MGSINLAGGDPHSREPSRRSGRGRRRFWVVDDVDCFCTRSLRFSLSPSCGALLLSFSHSPGSSARRGAAALVTSRPRGPMAGAVRHTHAVRVSLEFSFLPSPLRLFAFSARTHRPRNLQHRDKRLLIDL